MTPNTEKQARIAEDRAERELSQYMAAHVRSSPIAQRRVILHISEGRGMPIERGMGCSLKVEAHTVTMSNPTIGSLDGGKVAFGNMPDTERIEGISTNSENMLCVKRADSIESNALCPRARDNFNRRTR